MLQHRHIIYIHTVSSRTKGIECFALTIIVQLLRKHMHQWTNNRQTSSKHTVYFIRFSWSLNCHLYKSSFINLQVNTRQTNIVHRISLTHSLNIIQKRSYLRWKIFEWVFNCASKLNTSNLLLEKTSVNIDEWRMWNS